MDAPAKQPDALPSTSTGAAPQSPLASPLPWDLVADAYTAELLTSFERFADDALRLAELPEAAQVLDVAAGPGTLSLMAASRGARVEAIDFAPQMVENFKRRLAQSGATGVNVQVGDGQALPFADNSFDGAFSMFGLMFFPDRARGFRELQRVLRPGRRAVVSSWAPMEGILAAMFEAIRGALPGLPFGTNKAPLGEPAEFKQEILDAGFRDATVQSVVHEEITTTLAEFWGTLQRTMAPLVLLKQKLGAERWKEVAQVVYAKLEAENGPGNVSFIGRAYLGVGVK